MTLKAPSNLASSMPVLLFLNFALLTQGVGCAFYNAFQDPPEGSDDDVGILVDVEVDGSDTDDDAAPLIDEVLCTPQQAGFCIDDECATPRRIYAGYEHACLLLSDGRVACWGANDLGQVTGSPTAHPVTCPRLVEGIQDIRDLSLGWNHACTTGEFGLNRCWGDDAAGQSAPPTSFDARFVAAGAHHTCAVDSSPEQSVRCWGCDGIACLPDNLESLSPAASSGSVAAGWNTTCYLQNGRPHCIGANALNPIALDLGHQNAAVFGLTVGLDLACGIVDETGRALCWGPNDPRRKAAESPLDVASLYVAGPEFARLSAGPGEHLCGVTPDGAISCWGTNAEGQLGDDGLGAFASEPPAAIAIAPLADDVAVGAAFSCAIARNDKSVWCWGSNAQGILGSDGTTGSSRPRKIFPRQGDQP